jgi:hypothetical protein
MIAAASGPAIVAFAFFGCNTLLDNQPRVLYEGLGEGGIRHDSATEPTPDGTVPDNGDAAVVDADLEAGPVLPACDGGLTCAPAQATGASACHEATSNLDVFCCPAPNALIIESACAPALCGAGLTCSATPVTSGVACRASTTATTDKYCCPTPGSTISSGKCLTPVCGSGLYCATTPTPGASACRQTSSSNVDIYCCPSGQTLVSGKCA